MHDPILSPVCLTSHLSLFLLTSNCTHFSKDAKSVPWNSFHHSYSSFPPIFFTAFFILSVHLIWHSTLSSNNSHCFTDSVFLKAASNSHIAEANGHFSVTFTWLSQHVPNLTCPKLNTRSSPPSLLLFSPNLLLSLTYFLVCGARFL